MPLLIVASSGRALVASAAKRGMSAIVLDLYDDLDTRALALASRAVASRRGRFDARRLVAAANELCPAERCAGLVYGSGFEARPSLLDKLARGRVLFGNATATIALLKDPTRFFPLLDDLGIAHPAVSLAPQEDPSGWLVKRIGGAGGSHVHPAQRRHRSNARRYFQRWVPGRAMSVLFAADGTRARVIGYNEQWTAAGRPRSPYRYGGAVSCGEMPARVASTMQGALNRLVAATGLVGVNGLDFILSGDAPFVLEVNPRPTATVDLYDDAIEGGVLALHLRACRGDASFGRTSATEARAHAIVYADDTVRIPERFAWPVWCTDIPSANSEIPPGAPICSVHASAATADVARCLVLARRDKLARRTNAKRFEEAVA